MQEHVPLPASGSLSPGCLPPGDVEKAAVGVLQAAQSALALLTTTAGSLPSSSHDWPTCRRLLEGVVTYEFTDPIFEERPFSPTLLTSTPGQAGSPGSRHQDRHTPPVVPGDRHLEIETGLVPGQ